MTVHDQLDRERQRLIFEIARTFDVSMTAAEVRLRELGHIG